MVIIFFRDGIQKLSGLVYFYGLVGFKYSYLLVGVGIVVAIEILNIF